MKSLLLLVIICLVNLNCGKFTGSTSKPMPTISYVYVGTNAGLSISSDGGISWVTTTSGWNGFANSNLVTSVSASDRNVYAGTSGGLSISSDGGISWVTTTKNWNGFANSNAVNSIFSQQY